MSGQMVYKRILIKLSGEALAKDADGSILNNEFVRKIGETIKTCVESGVEVAVIVGGGNIWRGTMGVGMDRTRADHMGMLATTINALALQDAFEKEGVDTRVMTAIAMHEFAEPYIRNRAVHHLAEGRVVIFGCGIGNPFFSTDTAAVMRAAEINADIVMLAKNVPAIYSDDPKKNPNAVKLDEVNYSYIISNELKAIDLTATTFSKDNHIPLLVFGLSDPDNILRALRGEKIGTIVHDCEMN